jgi:hypothetical protein
MLSLPTPHLKIPLRQGKSFRSNCFPPTSSISASCGFAPRVKSPIRLSRVEVIEQIFILNYETG